MRPKGTKRNEKKYFSDSQWQSFQSAIKVDAFADFVFSLTLATGARVGEVASLKLEEMLLELNPPQVVIQGLKGGHKSSYVMTPELMRKYEKWMRTRKKLKTSQGSPFLFITKLTSYGNHVSRDLIQLLFKNFCAKAGINPKEFSVHSLRHTCAFNLAKEGRNVPEIQSYLRQRSPASALEYVKLIGKDRQEAIERVQPIINRLIK